MDLRSNSESFTPQAGTRKNVGRLVWILLEQDPGNQQLRYSFFFLRGAMQ